MPIWAQLAGLGRGDLSIQLDLSSSLCSDSGLSEEADDECVCVCGGGCWKKEERFFVQTSLITPCPSWSRCLGLDVIFGLKLTFVISF